jgi:hypothetical protein
LELKREIFELNFVNFYLINIKKFYQEGLFKLTVTDIKMLKMKEAFGLIFGNEINLN